MDYPTLVLRALHSCQTFEPAASSVDPRHKGEDDAGYLGEADQTYYCTAVSVNAADGGSTAT